MGYNLVESANYWFGEAEEREAQAQADSNSKKYASKMGYQDNLLDVFSEELIYEEDEVIDGEVEDVEAEIRPDGEKVVSKKNVIKRNGEEVASKETAVKANPEKSDEARTALQTGENLEVSPKEFASSLSKSKHKKMLSNMSISDLGKMRLFKVPSMNIGFALKDYTDPKTGRTTPKAEIVAVHNNEPDVKGVGKDLMKRAIKENGAFLDHFSSDVLDNLYSSLNFREIGREPYNKMYDQDGSFASRYGKLDVVYRALGQ